MHVLHECHTLVLSQSTSAALCVVYIVQCFSVALSVPLHLVVHLPSAASVTSRLPTLTQSVCCTQACSSMLLHGTRPRVRAAAAQSRACFLHCHIASNAAHQCRLSQPSVCTRGSARMNGNAAHNPIIKDIVVIRTNNRLCTVCQMSTQHCVVASKCITWCRSSVQR